MVGGFLSRVLLLAFGYAYPAYECYKTVELNKPEIEHLIFWCQYWILVSLLTVLERFGDVAVSWLPLYSEAKLMFFIYLWFPRQRELPMSMRPSLGHTSHNMRMILIAIFSSLEQELAICLSFTGRSPQL